MLEMKSIFLASILLFTMQVSAATYYHDGNGGDIENVASWFTDISLSTPAGQIPTVGDTGIVQAGANIPSSASDVLIDYHLIINAAAIVSLTNGLAIVDSTGKIDVYGTLTVKNSSLLNIENGGDIDVSGGIVNINGSQININSQTTSEFTNGTVNINGGTLTVQSNTTLNASNTVISVTSSGNFHGVGYPSTINLSSTTLNLISGASNNSAIFRLTNNSTVNISFGSSVTNFGSEYSFDSTSSIINAGTFTSFTPWLTGTGTFTTLTGAETYNYQNSPYIIYGEVNVPIVPYTLRSKTTKGSQNYNVMMSLSGPVTWSHMGLPGDFNLDTNTGTITGTTASLESAFVFLTATLPGGGFARQQVYLEIGTSTPDVDPANIVSLIATPAETSATIAFDYDEDADARIYYGPTTSFGSTDFDNVKTPSHSFSLTGLTNSTQYSYIIVGEDDAGNIGTSSVRTFTTLAPSAPVVVTPVPAVVVNRVSYGSEAPTTSYSLPTPQVVSNNGVCTPYIESLLPIKLGANNNVAEVKKVQEFLNTFQKNNLVVDGVYKQVDVQAVNAFQLKYKTQVLSPWGAAAPTGIVYLTTKAKINALVCGQNLGCPVFTKNTDSKSVHSDVPRVKNFLNQILGLKLNTNSNVMDVASVRAISTFQNRYKDFILKPLGLKNATGLWYESTIKQANAFMGCSL